MVPPSTAIKLIFITHHDLSVLRRDVRWDPPRKKVQKKERRKKKKGARRDGGKWEERSRPNEGTRNVECISQYSSHTEGVFIAGPKVLDARGTFEPLAETRWRR